MNGWSWQDLDEVLRSPTGDLYRHRGLARPSEIKSLLRGDVPLLEYEAGDDEDMSVSDRVEHLADQHIIRRKTPHVHDKAPDLTGSMRTFVSSDGATMLIAIAWHCHGA